MYAIVFHAHQKIDRVAYRHLTRLIGDGSFFPSVKDILYFEGRRGPDAVRLKNRAGQASPWHFIDPYDDSDTDLIETIANHFSQLTVSLKAGDMERASFESAWLAHALVDGLTPAHHFPFEEQLKSLRGDERISRQTVLGHLIIKGETVLQSVGKSLKLVGPKGLLTTHTAFEAGVFAMMLPITIGRAFPTTDEIVAVPAIGIEEYFQQMTREIADLDMYGRFYRSGWTPHLALMVRRELLPRLVKIVTLAWLSALIDAGLVKSFK